jgi:AcrR family transcriptional regulator
MQAAMSVFESLGYPDTTVDDIVRVAGASRATFYLHFRSKADVAAALVGDAIPFGIARYKILDELLCEGGEELRPRLRAWLAEWLQAWADTSGIDPTLPLQASPLLQAAMLEPDVQAQWLKLSTAVIDSLECYLGRIPESERPAVRNRALVLEIMTQRILALASTGQLPQSDDDMLSIMVAMWYHALVEGVPPYA